MLLLLVPAGVTAEGPPAGYRAQVVRDAYGVPHITGRGAGDVGYALARCQSEDRLSQVVHNLLAGAGRLTELRGAVALEADVIARTLQHREAVARSWREFPAELRALLTGFAAGVNDYLDAHPAALPGYRHRRPFDALDVGAWHRQVLLSPALGIARYDANMPLAGEHRTASAHPGIPAGQSNSWAVAGSRTASGRPALLMDPHWPIEGNLALYEARLRGGPLDCWGYALSGTPLLGIGATRGVAWALTAGGGDSSDAYALRLRPGQPFQYAWEGGWAKMRLRKEAFRIREGDGERLETRELRYARHGPVLENSRDEPYAAGLPGWGKAGSLLQFWRMATAVTAAQFRSAIALDEICYFNLMWAARTGEIGYLQTGQIPLRTQRYQHDHRKPGWKRDALPVDRVPFAALPQVESPPSGFLQNCNVAANAVTPGLLFRAEDFPPGTLWGHYGAYRARGQRATELLAAARNLDAARATEIVFDTYCPPADLWIPILVAAAEEEAARRPGDAADMAGAARRLRAWNRHVSADSTGATLFRFWRLACEALPGSRAGRDDFAIGDTPELRRDCVTVLRAALEELRRRYGRPGTPEIPWGEIKRLRRGDREWPLSGDGLERLGLDTLRATAAATFDDRGRLIATGGQSHIGLVFLGEVPQIHAVVAYGQSNNPSSPHYADQAPLYAGHRLRPVPWTHEAVLGEATARREVRSPSPARRRQ